MVAPSVVSVVPSTAPVLILQILTAFCEVVLLSPFHHHYFRHCHCYHYCLWMTKVRHRDANKVARATQ